MIPNPCPQCGREAGYPIPYCPRCNFGFEEACPELMEDMAKFFYPWKGGVEMSESELRQEIEFKQAQRSVLDAEIAVLKNKLALLLCPFKVGDIVSTETGEYVYHSGRFKVTNVVWQYGKPAIVGQRFKKDGTLGLQSFVIGNLEDFKLEV
jgi:hypothetical protein